MHRANTAFALITPIGHRFASWLVCGPTKNRVNIPKIDLNFTKINNYT